jgi:hypothetical protein
MNSKSLSYSLSRRTKSTQSKLLLGLGLSLTIFCLWGASLGLLLDTGNDEESAVKATEAPEPKPEPRGRREAAESKKEEPKNKNPSSAVSSTSSSYDPFSYQKQELLGVDFILQLPAQKKPPKALLFIGKGCWHPNIYFFPPTPDVCPECIGLPEEKAVVQYAVEEFEFAVAAFSSRKACWTKKDGPSVAAVLKELSKTLAQQYRLVGIHTLPIFALAPSVGASFIASQLVMAMEDLEQPLDALIILIPEPCTSPKDYSKKYSVPISAWITMDMDPRRTCTRMIKGLRNDGHVVQHHRLSQLPVTDSFFHERIPGVSLEHSQKMAAALLKKKFIDSNRIVVNDPKHDTVWKDILRDLKPEGDTFEEDFHSPTLEVLGVAHAFHEFSRDGVQEAFHFVLEEYYKKHALEKKVQLTVGW